MDFSQAIVDQLSTVPAGYVVSYGQLAAACGRPRAARLVAGALNRRGQRAPCPRVIRADGSLPPESVFGAGVQRGLLISEGVAFLPDGRVDMARCRWPLNAQP